MCGEGQAKATLYLGEKPFRELDSRSWDVARRLDDMDRDGVAMQVLSPMPELLSYWQSPTDAEFLADYINDAIAAMVAQNPARFAGLGMIPLQDPQQAVRYASTLKQRFGLIGVEIGSNINGILPGDSRFDPFFAAAAEHDLAIFIHALHPVATAEVMTDVPFFGPLVGFPLDVGMAGASLIFKGVLTRHPRLRIALSHGGGAMATLLGRMDNAWKAAQNGGNASPARPSDQARSLFYDGNVYNPALLRYLVCEMAPGQVCVGTDYPYLIMQHEPADYVRSAHLSDGELRQLTHEAARRFLIKTIA